MKKSNKIVAVILAFVTMLTAIPMMTASADIGDILGKDEDKHEHVYVIQSVEEGSCTEVAKTTFKCACGDVQVLTTGKPSHTPAVGGYANKNAEVHTNYCTKCKTVFEEKHDEYELYEEWVTPTCEKAGKEVYKCRKCGAKRTVTIEPSVHVPSGIIVKDANKHGFTCVACEKLIDENHVWDEGTLDKGIKCGDDGKIIYRCKVFGCNGKKEVTVPSTCVYPDKKDIEDGLAPKVNKFDEEGKNHTFECIYCSRDKVEAHEFVVEYTVTKTVVNKVSKNAAEPAPTEPTTAEATTEAPTTEEPTTEAPTTEEPTTKHTHTYGNWDVTKEPTCKEPGFQVRKCACGEIDGKIIPATGDHSYEWIVVKEPTVTENGKEVCQCTKCGQIKETAITELKINTPTCKDEGEILVSCKYCNYSYTAIVDTVDHKIKEDAKCTKFSKDKHKTECVYCGEVKVPHTWGEWKVTKPATAENEGEKVRECTGCGEKDTVKIDKVTVSLGDVTGDGNISAVDARIVLQSVAGLRTLTAKEQEAADMNGDGNITAADARKILQTVAAGTN